MDLVHARARRRFQRGLGRKAMGLIKKLRKAKKEQQPNEKPATVKTHLRDMIIVPEMVGSVVGVYNGKVGPHLMRSRRLKGGTSLISLCNELPGLQHRRNQGRDGRVLPRRILHFLQTHHARKTR